MTGQAPIAIVGMGGCLPGGDSLDQFWANVEAGVDTSSEVPRGRWALDPELAYDERKGRPDKVYSRRACLLEPTPRFVELEQGFELLASLDPVVHLALVAGHAAWKDAGLRDVDEHRVGVILGNIALPTESSSRLAGEILGRSFERRLFETTGRVAPGESQSPSAWINRWGPGLPAGVLARSLGLGGGHVALDAACASSLFALKLAVDELRAGRADAMLTGGLSRPDPLYTQMGFSQLGALSPSGRCSPFDRRADGLVVGEGSGVFVLRRLEDALRAGERIHAVIRGIGLSNDVDGTLLAPNQEGQLRAMRAAYRAAGWQASDVDLIECHATGTPIGDATEYASLRGLWGEQGWSGGQCVLGSVKSNVGHLLTGAGAAALLKTLLALRHQTLPPTANFERPAPGIDLEAGPFRVLAKSEPWPRRAPELPRRAAVSGFGFGGTNAHVLLEEFEAQGQVQAAESFTISRPTEPAPETPISIVGMAAAVGPWTDQRSFQRRVLGGETSTRPSLKRNFWSLPEPPRGWFIEELGIPLGEFRIPPRELEESLPQQTLMLQVAKRALEDAALPELNRLRTGVFIGITLDQSTTNFHLRWSIRQRAATWARELGLELQEAELEAWTDELCSSAGPSLNANRTMGALGGIVASRISREFGLGGPCFVLSSEEGSGYSALAAAVRALRLGELDAALVGAVDFPGDPRSPACSAESGQAGDSQLVGEGAVAVLLVRDPDARAAKARVYAAILGLGSSTGGVLGSTEPEARAYRLALERAYAEAQVDPATIAYVDASAWSDSAASALEERELGAFFTGAPVLGSVRAEVGNTGAADFLMALAKTSLCLYQEILPPSRELARGNETVPGRLRPPRYWLQDQAQGPRRAAISSVSASGLHAHAVLEAASTSPRELERKQPLGSDEEAFFCIEADEESGLLLELRHLSELLDTHKAPVIATLAQAWWRSHGQRPEARLGLALIARDARELRRLIEEAREGVSHGESLGVAGSGQERVFHAPRPLAKEASVAFVFPGSGSQYPGMGRDLSTRWPEIFRAQGELHRNLRTQLRPDRIWGEAKPGQDPDARELILAQVTLGTLVSDLLRKFIQPQAVIGYSLGETAGLFSLGAWQARDEMLGRVLDSPLFVSELTGSCEAAKRSWKLPPEAAVRWSIGVVDRPRAAVEQALSGIERAYLLIVNTQDECVIGGDPDAVRQVVERLGSSFVPLHGVTTVHCEVARLVEAEYRDLHRLPTSAPEGVRFYSGAWGKAYAVDRESAADSIVAQAVEGFDFTKVIQQAWADGVRLFIEAGPGRSCTRMIAKILQGKRFAARSACFEGQESTGSLLRVLGLLIAERAEVRLAPLFDAHEIAPALQRRSITVPVGGTGFGPIHLPRPAPQPQLPAESIQSRAPFPPAAHSFLDAARSALPQGIVAFADQGARAHDVFLRLASSVTDLLARQARFQMQLLSLPAQASSRPMPSVSPSAYPVETVFPSSKAATPGSALFLDRAECLEFAVGSIGRVLGPEFAPIDGHPTRVRLPDEPLMLVDRILSLEAEPRSMTSGHLVTEHDVLPGSWYLDAGRIPTCIAVEAGQADLFLSAYLGIDFITEGRAVYRLLDAVVTFHDELPRPGQTIRYAISIDRFFQQSGVWLFQFRFDATVDGRLLLTMRDGCAGFFTEEQLDAGKGIVQGRLARQPTTSSSEAWSPLVPLQEQSLTELEVEALRAGDLALAFGGAFAGLPILRPATIPGGRMRLVHRVRKIDPKGGRAGLGSIVAEADVHPDDWFLTCHFVDDRVMPGTLMYECCLHTLRILLLRLGWVGEEGAVVCQPVPGVQSRLKCRGQVLESTKLVTYEINLRELGYGPEPYAIADALMYADGKPIVEIGSMSLRLSGLTRDALEALWASRGQSAGPAAKPAVYDSSRILAFSSGKPSEAFGEPYRVFDEERRIARLPRPPFQFLDRITAVEGMAFEMRAGASCEAQFDLTPEAWFFSSNRQLEIPFSVLLEIALQPCGWLAAYVGSALTSPVDLRFRNLGGSAVLHAPVLPESDVLTTTARLTNVSSSGGMIIQHYSFLVEGQRRGKLYEGTTYFGFFSQQALAEQVGLRDVKRFQPEPSPTAPDLAFSVPTEPPFPDPRMRMVDRIDLYVPDGGPHGLGFLRGSILVDPKFWFFDAHFYQDPVWPGSLGLEAFLQLLKVAAARRWGTTPSTAFLTMPLGVRHEWIYRGQVIPSCTKVEVEATITAIDEPRRRLVADGFLIVDGRPIYQMKDFALETKA